MIVVSDTSPICYLLLISQIEVLRDLYQVVIIPQVVADELSDPETPALVRDWIAQPPTWLKIQPVELPQDIASVALDPGEKEAIALAEQLSADLTILDDRAARQIAVGRGLRIIGLLGVLKDAARNGLLDLEKAFQQLSAVGFWVAPSLLERLLSDN